VRERSPLQSKRYLIRDHDSKFTASFDEVLRTEGVAVIPTPIRAPKANAYAERFVGTARRECLDWILVLGRRHLERTLTSYIAHYNEADHTEALDWPCRTDLVRLATRSSRAACAAKTSWEG
jgi:transposase InsO family protein